VKIEGSDHYSIVIMDKNRYSVPTEHAGFEVQIVVSVDRVKIFHDGREIANHMEPGILSEHDYST